MLVKEPMTKYRGHGFAGARRRGCQVHALGRNFLA